ncbi:MAG: protein-L-isoaspartate(D-aspartate) O-methyltransferase [Phycisphaerales bacterium]|nr:protein-L-isoaspartate(D-aspartate) O-methyltransferase [Phycisphaerales bacterium]
MIDTQISARGIRDPRVLAAMDAVPRERFVPEALRSAAYEDRALPIDEQQTISQPYIVAYMTDALCVAPHHRVLEVGTGSGYQVAVLAHLANEVHTIERLEVLSETAARRVAALGIQNVQFHLGDGSLGWPDAAPYDRIIVTAAAPAVPPALIAQLVEGGILVLPVGEQGKQTLVSATRRAHRTVERVLIACRFVRLVGRDAWHGS